MAFDNFCTKAVVLASPGPTPKRCEPQLFLAALGQVIRCSKALNLGSLNMQFQHDWPKDIKITALLIFLPENLEKYHSTELYDAPLEWSTIFLYRSSTSHTLLDSSALAELKYAFVSRTGRNTKKLRRSNLFQLTIFKHGLLEGSTILLQYSSLSRAKLESSLLGELKCGIWAGYDVILKNKSIRKCKNWHCATNVHGHCSMGYQRDRYFFSRHSYSNRAPLDSSRLGEQKYAISKR